MIWEAWMNQCQNDVYLFLQKFDIENELFVSYFIDCSPHLKIFYINCMSSVQLVKENSQNCFSKNKFLQVKLKISWDFTFYEVFFWKIQLKYCTLHVRSSLIINTEKSNAAWRLISPTFGCTKNPEGKSWRKAKVADIPVIIIFKWTRWSMI